MLLHPLTNFEIQKYYRHEPEFSGVYSGNNLPKIKDWTYVINIDEYKWKGTHWIALYVNRNNITYVGRFGVEKEIKKFIDNKNIITNIFRLQGYISIMCRYFCIGFIAFMLKGQSLLDYTNIFYPKKYEKNDKIILKLFQ